jgi:DNA-binding beta-propeller fold protein YncE
MPNPARRPLPALVVFAVLAFAVPARAAHLTGVSFEDGLVYDVDVQTGAATHPRTLSFANVVLDDWAGVEIAPDGTMLLIPVETAEFYGSNLIGAHIQASLALWADPLAVQIGEGDLALDPVTGDLYALGLTDLTIPFTLVRIEPGANGFEDATASVVGEIGSSDVSGLAFDASGTLYALDTATGTTGALRILDPSDAHEISSTPLSTKLGPIAGMDFDPATGTLYVADGGSGPSGDTGTDSLYTLNPANGVLTTIGPLGIAGGLSGLVVPEPQAALLGVAACAALAAVTARCR